ncbi:MAG TPA: methyltransferase domain-containing protein [Acidimicrobiia bacterium]|nr:methyltransferase domain-containing protein [Acidimicrobiia bacterium]
MSSRGSDQLTMLHRLPAARLVDRFPYVSGLCRGRRVVHVGFADAGYDEMQHGAGTWLHSHLASVTSGLVGIDVDAAGVERANADGYEAYLADACDRDAIEALGIEPADVVLAGEVIEHVDAPGAFLDAMRPLVTRGGKLVLTTPNASSLGNALLAFAGIEITHPDHVLNFSWLTLDTLLRRHDWQPARWSTFVPSMKPLQRVGARARVLEAGARALLWAERTAARLGAPFVAEGMIVEAHPV